MKPLIQIFHLKNIFRGSDLDEVRKMAGNLSSKVIRSKGFVGVSGVWYLFSNVMGTWNIDKSQVPEHRIKNKNTLVFIASTDAMPEIEQALKTENWIHRGAL